MLRWTLLLSLLLVTPAFAQGGGIEDVVRGAPSSSEPVQHSGFAGHVREAIAVNKARREVYAELSAGASKPVSRNLIAGEKATLIIARWLDWRAKRFNEEGIGIVRDDFIPLADLPPAETPPLYRGRATKQQKKELCQVLEAYHDDLKEHLDQDDFAAAAERTREVLAEARAFEESMGVHWAMTVHVIEQIGYAAERAEGYVQEDPEATKLAKRFVRVLAWGLMSATTLDRMAQKSHQKGVGILVNDLPPIPFHAHTAD
jgi:hypothetical protein